MEELKALLSLSLSNNRLYIPQTDKAMSSNSGTT
jgi:hypothetical protein